MIVKMKYYCCFWKDPSRFQFFSFCSKLYINVHVNIYTNLNRLSLLNLTCNNINNNNNSSNNFRITITKKIRDLVSKQIEKAWRNLSFRDIFQPVVSSTRGAVRVTLLPTRSHNAARMNILTVPSCLKPRPCLSAARGQTETNRELKWRSW